MCPVSGESPTGGKYSRDLVAPAACGRERESELGENRSWAATSLFWLASERKTLFVLSCFLVDMFSGGVVVGDPCFQNPLKRGKAALASRLRSRKKKAVNELRSTTVTRQAQNKQSHAYEIVDLNANVHTHSSLRNQFIYSQTMFSGFTDLRDPSCLLCKS